jgi:quinohemoprotein ethanol dehydrogenase
MSYNPQTGLVYLPAQNVPINLVDDKEWKQDVPLPLRVGSGIGWNTGFLFGAEQTQTEPFGRLIAWNPITQREVWRHEQVSPWNGGTLTTAGNLVFQGTGDGRLLAFDATTGDRLWESPTGTGVIAAPVTYQVDGKQYVSIAVGWGGTVGLAARATEKTALGTVFTFAIGGTAPLPEFAQYRMEALLSGIPYDPADVAAGQGLYVSNCLVCHGVPGVDRGGNIRNLAYSGPGIITGLERILFDGVYSNAGMPDFSTKLTPDDVVKLRAFIQGTADQIRGGQTPDVPPSKSTPDTDPPAVDVPAG